MVSSSPTRRKRITLFHFFSITRARQMSFKRPTPRRIGVFYLLFVSLKNDAVDFGVHPRSTLEVCVGVRVGGRFIDGQFSGNKGLRYLHHPGRECLCCQCATLKAREKSGQTVFARRRFSLKKGNIIGSSRQGTRLQIHFYQTNSRFLSEHC